MATIGRVQTNSGGKRQAYYQSQVSTGKRRPLSPLVPLGLTSQVPDQWIFTGGTPEWSDSEVPAQKVTGDLPVIRLVLGLPFSIAIFRTLPIRKRPLVMSRSFITIFTIEKLTILSMLLLRIVKKPSHLMNEKYSLNLFVFNSLDLIF